MMNGWIVDGYYGERYATDTDGSTVVHSKWRSLKWKMLTKERGKKCEKCGKKLNLHLAHLHHRHYRTFLHETPDDLSILCAECHADFHERKKKNLLTESDTPFMDKGGVNL